MMLFAAEGGWAMLVELIVMEQRYHAGHGGRLGSAGHRGGPPLWGCPARRCMAGSAVMRAKGWLAWPIILTGPPISPASCMLRLRR